MRTFKFFRGTDLYDRSDPRSYDTDDFEFVGLTPIALRDETGVPFKEMIFRHKTTGEYTKGPIIYENDPLWNYERG